MASHLKAKSLRIASVIFHPLVIYSLSGLFGYRQKPPGWGEILFCFLDFLRIYMDIAHFQTYQAMCDLHVCNITSQNSFPVFFDGDLDDLCFWFRKFCVRKKWLVICFSERKFGDSTYEKKHI